ncbi:MAG: transposase [Chloroflexota bacterium]
MPDYRRLYQNGGTYFFTVVTHERRPVFQNEQSVALLIECFKRVAQQHPFIVEAVVILPDHLHTIWTLPDGECDFSTRWNLIKGAFSRQYVEPYNSPSASCRKKRERTVWQRRFWEHLVRSQDELNRLCDYIHYNPVKHGLAESPADWPHSTFKEFVAKGLYPQDWGLTVNKELSEMSLE